VAGDDTKALSITVISPGDSTSINLDSLNGSGTFTGSKWSYDQSTGVITITGSDTLTVTGTSPSVEIDTGPTEAVINFNGSTQSIDMRGNGKLVINEGASIVSTGNAITSDGDVEINGGTVSSSSSGAAITTTDGNVTVNSGTVSSVTGSAIFTTNANVAVRGGTVTAPGTSANPTINAGGNVTVSGSGLVKSTDNNAGGIAIESTGHVQIDGGGVFANIDTGIAISASTIAVTNGVVSAQTTGVAPSNITAGLVIDGSTDTGKVYGNTSVKVDTEIPAGTIVSFEQGSVLNVEVNATVTIYGELDTAAGTVNVYWRLVGTGTVSGNGSLVKKTGGYIADSLGIGQNVNQFDESSTNPSNPTNAESAESMGCGMGIPGIVILALLAIFSLVQAAKKRVHKKK
jgi:hypothetical protein